MISSAPVVQATLLSLLLALSQPSLQAQGEASVAQSDVASAAEPVEAPEGGDRSGTTPPEAPSTTPPTDANGLPAFPPRSSFDEMLQRPLFSSSRRPESGDDSGGGSAQELRDTWKLSGIVMVGNELRAMFQERNGDRRLTIGTGMPLDAHWTLDEIHPTTVVMGSGEEQVTLELLEPRDTTPVQQAGGKGESRGEKTGGEAAPVDQRTRDARRQLQQNTENVKETRNE